MRARSHPARLRLAALSVAAATVCGLLGVVPATDSAVAADVVLRKVDPDLLTDLDGGGTHDLVIEFDESADLSRARQLDDWVRRGEAVVEALQHTAQASQADVIADLRSQRVQFQSFWITNTIVVEAATREVAVASAADAAVAQVRAPDRVELEQPREVSAPPTDAAGSAEPVGPAGVEWGVADIKADQVWDQYDTRGEGIVVASIDSGAQFDHPALVASYRGNRHDGSFDHDYNWFDPGAICALPSVEPCDNIGHGTHTIGTMVGDGGTGNRIGVAPGASWISAKGCEFEGCSEPGLAAAAQWVLQPTDLGGADPDSSMRPHIVNNSWSATGGNDWYQDFVRAWVAAGMFPVFSNGNTGPACGTVGAPGEYPLSYAVGDYDVNGRISETSARGPGTSGAIKPDISAPGTAVRSSVPADGYAVYSGTSMAAPHASGTVALLWSAAPALIGDIDATRRLLDDTARDELDDQCGGDADDNNVYGEGRLDALAVLTSAPTGAVGTLRGTVTEASTGEPVAGADIAITGAASRSASTGADGEYDLSLTAGTYDVEITVFGYETVRLDDVVVAADQVKVRDAELTRLKTVGLSGTVTDGSGHGWPLYAEVSVPGSPLRTFTDPATGAYALEVPAAAGVDVEVTPVYPGYRPRTTELDVSEDTTADFRLEVDEAACAAPGYERGPAGLHESFDTTEVPPGWEIVDHQGSGEVWAFDDPGGHGNRTGGTGGFAVVNSFDYGAGGAQDTSLVTPALDLTGVERPIVEFATDLEIIYFDRADVDVSLDGGETWQNVWRRADDVAGASTVRVELPMAAGASDVRVRFHYAFASHNWWWQIDDVFVGAADCRPAPGGLLVGRTTSTLTGAAVDGAEVASRRVAGDHATSVATPRDDAIGDGLYWLFSSKTGRQAFTAGQGELSPQTQRVRVQPDAVTWQDFELGAGRLEVSSTTVERTLSRKHFASASVTLTNTGDRPATYRLVERDGPALAGERPARAAQPDGFGGAPARRLPAEVSPLPGGSAPTPDGPAHALGEAIWNVLAPYPTTIKDSVAGYLDGRLYSFGGVLGLGRPLATAYVYDEATAAWTRLADLPQAREKPAGAFIDGRFVLTGGWGTDLDPVATTSIYDPATDTWSPAAPNPAPLAASGTAVLDGHVYVVGGCAQECGSTDVMRYDPEADAWTRLADYPQNTAWTACGGIAGRVYCAGGFGPDSDGLSAYAYDPATDSWQQVADMPLDLWGSAYAVVDGRLIVSGGAVERGSAITNETFAYDPGTDTWTPLPNSNFALYRTAGTCGFHKVGGSAGTTYGDKAVERLSGYTDCSPAAEQDWLRTTHPSGVIEPGQSRTIRIRFDARQVDGPGAYVANLRIDEDTPSSVPPVTVTMNVERRADRQVPVSSS